MKLFLKILKVLPLLLSRIAHVIEHFFCDEVPSIHFDDVDGYDVDPIEPPGLDPLFSDVDDDDGNDPIVTPDLNFDDDVGNDPIVTPDLNFDDNEEV